MSLLDALTGNLLSPMVLFFLLGALAAMVKSDLVIPESIAKGMSIYLMVAIGFKGGTAVAEHGVDWQLFLTLVFGGLLSFALPFAAYGLLRRLTRAGRIDASAIAAHYGSISIVTFISAAEFLASNGAPGEGFLVATAAVMEFPAILAGLWLAGRALSKDGGSQFDTPSLLREVLVNGSVVLLIGSFAIGLLTGDEGTEAVKPFLLDPFKGVLCIFLLDMGLVAAQRLRGTQGLDWRLLLFALYMPLIGAAAGLLGGWAIGLSEGGVTLLAVLGASASYIAVPAAMRLALPQANPGLYLACSLAITFPFNMLLGIPLYWSCARFLTGG
jgi:hypothetical protein